MKELAQSPQTFRGPEGLAHRHAAQGVSVVMSVHCVASKVSAEPLRGQDSPSPRVGLAVLWVKDKPYLLATFLGLSVISTRPAAFFVTM